MRQLIKEKLQKIASIAMYIDEYYKHKLTLTIPLIPFILKLTRTVYFNPEEPSIFHLLGGKHDTTKIDYYIDRCIDEYERRYIYSALYITSLAYKNRLIYEHLYNNHPKSKEIIHYCNDILSFCILHRLKDEFDWVIKKSININVSSSTFTNYKPSDPFFVAIKTKQIHYIRRLIAHDYNLRRLYGNEEKLVENCFRTVESLPGEFHRTLQIPKDPESISFYEDLFRLIKGKITPHQYLKLAEELEILIDDSKITNIIIKKF